MSRDKAFKLRMNLTRNKDAEWDKFLGEVAREVDGLIMDTVYLKEFRRQIRSFTEKWNNHISDSKEDDKKRREHWEKVKANPKWQDKDAGPPEEGWEWDRNYLSYVGSNIGPVYEMPARYAPDLMGAIEKYIERNEEEKKQYPPTSAEYQNFERIIAGQRQNVLEIRVQFETLNPEQRKKAWIKTPPDLDKRPPNITYTHIQWWVYLDLNEEAVFGCWRPRLKKIRPDPRKTLIPEKSKQSLPPAKSQEQEYERYYVVLTSIHDNMLPGVQRISKSISLTELADSVWFRFTDGQPYGPDRPFIEVALERVRVDLAQRQGNKSSIISWLVEGIIALVLLVISLYFFGVVTGIFVFAALLTIFHYLGWLELIRAFISNILRSK